MAEFPGFVGPSYRSQSRYAQDDRCINFYLEQLNEKKWILAPTPGLSTLAEPAFNPCRGSLAMDDRAFFVIGYKFYELDDDAATLIERGEVAVNDNPATLTSSGDQGRELMITSGRSVYIYNLDDDSFDLVPDVDADFGAYLSGRFIVLDTELSKLQISDVDDGLTWNPLRYRLRSKAPDKWRSMAVYNDVIWLMGSQSYEVWWDSGASPFPFEPISGALFPVGIAAPYTLKGIGGAIHWVSADKDGNGIVMQAVQYSPKRISNHGIEFPIQSFTNLEGCESMTYQMFGHNFWVLTSRDDDQSWQYDATSGMWNENLDWEVSSNRPAQWTAWRPMYHCFAFGRHIAGDRNNGIIYEMSPEFFTGANGSLIRRVRRAPHLQFENKNLRYRSLEIDLQRGNGQVSGDGAIPDVMMRYSDDAGITFGNELMISSGEIGKYSTRVKFYRLGASRNRVFEVSVSDPAPWYITGAFLNL